MYGHLAQALLIQDASESKLPREDALLENGEAVVRARRISGTLRSSAALPALLPLPRSRRWAPVCASQPPLPARVRASDSQTGSGLECAWGTSSQAAHCCDVGNALSVV